MHNLWHIYDAVSRAVGDDDAIRWRGRAWTHHDLRDRATRFANVLASHGLGTHVERRDLEAWESGQDLVATYLLNGPEYLEVTLGGYAGRAAPFNVNYRYVATELRYLLDDAGAAAIVFHARFAPLLAEVLPDLRRPPLLLQVQDDSGSPLLDGAIDYEQALADADSELAVDDHDPDDLYVLYTGGTTGMPKGTLWRQGDIWTAALGGDMVPDLDPNALAAAARASNRSNRFLPNAPLMHGAAHWLALRTLLGGGTVVINDVVDRLDPADVWRLVEAEQVASTLMVGESFIRPLLDELEANPTDTSSVTLVVVGGAATSPETKRRMLRHLPGALILDAAGASETGSALSAVAAGTDAGEAAVFAPGDGVVVLDADLAAIEAPGHADVGWLAKTGAIPLGYLGDEAKTRSTFPTIGGSRWSVPGDRARHRADGMIELLGRDSVTINTGGEKVYAEEVESALLAHEAVRDVVVTWRPSERWGQEVVAVLSLNNPVVTDDELLEVAGQRIARYKLPRAIVRVDEVLRSPAGKADYRWAQEIAKTGA